MNRRNGFGAVMPGALAFALLLPAVSQASFVNFYSITNVNTVGRLGLSYDFGAITATASQASGTPVALTVSNFGLTDPDEIGIGICGAHDAGTLCKLGAPLVQLNLPESNWEGDYTEIDNAGDNERLNLGANAGYQLTGKFILGSFDSNGSTFDLEDGYVQYGSKIVRFARTTSGAAITSGNATIAQAGAGFGDEVFLLTINDFDPAANLTVVFGAGGTPTSGTNNDYLVAAADVQQVVPVPAAAWLFASGLGLAVGVRRRRKG